MPEVSLKISSADATPLVTDQVGDIIKANLPGLDTIAGLAGTDVIVEVSGTPGQAVRLSVAEIGGVGLDIPLGSHEGNLVLQDPTFIDATIGAGGSVSVPIALPAVTPTASLAAGSVSGLFAITAALMNTATGEATSLVSQTLVVKDAPNSFTSEAGIDDTFVFNIPPQSVPTITAFTSGEDLLQISAAGFGAGLTPGATPTLAIGAPASISNPGPDGAFIFDNTDPASGTLYWDATGGSGADATPVVNLQGVTLLHPYDLYVV
jgi:hypothetical protein